MGTVESAGMTMRTCSVTERRRRKGRVTVVTRSPYGLYGLIGRDVRGPISFSEARFARGKRGRDVNNVDFPFCSQGYSERRME